MANDIDDVEQRSWARLAEWMKQRYHAECSAVSGLHRLASQAAFEGQPLPYQLDLQVCPTAIICVVASLPSHNTTYQPSCYAFCQAKLRLHSSFASTWPCPCQLDLQGCPVPQSSSLSECETAQNLPADCEPGSALLGQETCCLIWCSFKQRDGFALYVKREQRLIVHQHY